ncbi:MAG: hypothetical protein ACI4JN_12510 [Ruminococcus sp.]
MNKVNKIFAGLLFSLLVMLGFMFPAGSSDKMVQQIEASANDLTSILPVKGEVNGNGVYGYTTNYVCYGGEKEIQHKVQDGWHITLVNSYYSHDVMWFECWDSDDGDYYGWIDYNYITVYDYSYPDVVPETITPRKGQVAGNGVYGYTTGYVLYDGSKTTEHKVQDTWHITAYRTAYSHGVTWYECWDTDDGDYYGWIDGNYLSFYDVTPQPQPQPQPQPVTSLITVTVTVPITVTETVTVTVTETNPPTEPAPQTVTTAMTSDSEYVIAENVNDSDDSGSDKDGQIIIIIIAAAVVIVIAAAAVIIALLGRKPRYAAKVPTVSEQITQSSDDAVYCMNCGTRKPGPNVAFCPKCGQSYRKRQ